MKRDGQGVVRHRYSAYKRKSEIMSLTASWLDLLSHTVFSNVYVALAMIFVEHLVPAPISISTTKSTLFLAVMFGCE
jgi:hypothetical protein